MTRGDTRHPAVPGARDAGPPCFLPGSGAGRGGSEVGGPPAWRVGTATQSHLLNAPDAATWRSVVHAAGAALARREETALSPRKLPPWPAFGGGCLGAPLEPRGPRSFGSRALVS